MNVLPIKKQIEIVAALVRGSGIRATSAITEANKLTISKLALAVGEGCARLLDGRMRNLNASVLQFDEQWSFVHTKEAHLTHESPADFGDQWTFVALDVPSRAVIHHLVGKRNAATTDEFVSNVRARIVSRPQISADAFAAYVDAVDLAFGRDDVDFGVYKKLYENDKDDTDEDGAALPTAAGKTKKKRQRKRKNYKGAEKVVVFGRPDMKAINTSYVERSNLTTRTWQRRFTRRAITFSKSLRHHVAAVALHYAWYNFGHIHATLRQTPAMALGIEDHVWSVGELVERAFMAPVPPPLDANGGALGKGGQLKLPFPPPGASGSGGSF